MNWILNMSLMSQLAVRRQLNRCTGLWTANRTPVCLRLTTIANHSSHSSQSSSSTTQPSIDDNLLNNPFYAKYQNKLQKAITNNKPVNTIVTPSDQPDPQMTRESQTRLNHLNANQTTDLKPNLHLNKSLNDIMRLDLLTDKTSDEITDIWKSYHSKKDCVYGVMGSDIYSRIYQMGCKYPTFILAVPNTITTSDGDVDGSGHNVANGYRMVLSRFDGHKCFLTPLSAYHKCGEKAAVCLTVHHFTELEVSKHIVLMCGELDTNVLNIFEAQCLINQLQWYYGSQDNQSQAILLHQFNCQPNTFDYNHVIQQLHNSITQSNI